MLDLFTSVYMSVVTVTVPWRLINSTASASITACTSGRRPFVTFALEGSLKWRTNFAKKARTTAESSSTNARENSTHSLATIMSNCSCVSGFALGMLAFGAATPTGTTGAAAAATGPKVDGTVLDPSGARYSLRCRAGSSESTPEHGEPCSASACHCQTTRGTSRTQRAHASSKRRA
jgi:hypothetical protein